MDDSRPAEEAQRLREHIANWKAITPILEAERRAQIKASDLQRGIRAYGGLVSMALRRRAPAPTSGLIEMQRHFQTLRRHD